MNTQTQALTCLLAHDYKALGDMTRCLACRHKFSPDDIRSNVYNDIGCIGAIHECCYFILGVPRREAAFADASETRPRELIGITV